MVRLIVGLTAAGLILAGCSSDKSSGAAAAAAADGKRQAGSWKSTITLNEFAVAGAPPELKTAMQGMMTAKSKDEVCLTADQAAKENLAESLAKSQASNNCTFPTKDMAGGKLNVVAICKDPSGKTLNLKIAGTSTATTTNVKTEMTGQAPTGGEMKMVVTIDAERTGDCKPGQKTMNGSLAS